MYNEQEEILREQIYDVIRCCCNMKKSKFSPDILINYGADELCGEAADDLTFEHIPDILGIPNAYDFPFPNNIYFRDSGNPVTLIIDLFKREKDTRPPLTAKEYTDMILAIYKEYQAKQRQEQERIDSLIETIPTEIKDHLQKKLFLLLMQTLSIKEEEFSSDIIINEGIYKLSGKKAERFIHQSALCFNLPSNKVYNHFQDKGYFDLSSTLIGWIMLIIFSPIFIFAFIFMTIYNCIMLLIDCYDFIKTGKWESIINDDFSQKKSKTITANEYLHEMLGLWAENQQNQNY